MINGVSSPTFQDEDEQSAMIFFIQLTENEEKITKMKKSDFYP